MELGIGICCLQCHRLDAEGIEKRNWKQIPCSIHFYCAHVPPIQRLEPQYREAFGPQLPRPPPRRKRSPVAASISPPCGRAPSPLPAAELPLPSPLQDPRPVGRSGGRCSQRPWRRPAHGCNSGGPGRVAPLCPESGTAAPVSSALLPSAAESGSAAPPSSAPESGGVVPVPSAPSPAPPRRSLPRRSPPPPNPAAPRRSPPPPSPVSSMGGGSGRRRGRRGKNSREMSKFQFLTLSHPNVN